MYGYQLKTISQLLLELAPSGRQAEIRYKLLFPIHWLRGMAQCELEEPPRSQG